MSKSINREARWAQYFQLWRRHGWLVIAALWVVALALGLAGFALDATASGQPVRLPDIAYRTLQLIPMNSGDVAAPPWQLDAARFLIPFLAAWTAIRALLTLFRDRWQHFLLRYWRDHVVICGLSRKGWLLAQGFVARGERVVVIEADESHDLIAPCRERGIAVLTGDATDPDLLSRAGALRAHHVVAVTDDDGINAEISVRCHDLLRKNTRTQSSGLTCTAHLVDPELYELARTRELTLEAGVPLRLELFNVFERGAQLLWSQYGPPMDGERAGHEATSGCSAHLLVIGLGRLGESLVVTAGREWHTRIHQSPRTASDGLRVTVVDGDAERKCRALTERYPQLATVCELRPETMNVASPEFYSGDFLRRAAGDGDPAIGVIFVCFDDDSLGLRTGLTVHQHLLRHGVSGTPIVVRMAEAGGLARLIDPDGDEADEIFADLHAFPLLDRTCTPEAILGGRHEVLARGLHEARLRQQQALGKSAATDPSLVEWERLPNDLRERNRAAATGILEGLAGLGYGVVPLTDWDAAFLRLPDAPAYDAVRDLPATLARAGFQIIPVPARREVSP